MSHFLQPFKCMSRLQSSGTYEITTCHTKLNCVSYQELIVESTSGGKSKHMSTTTEVHTQCCTLLAAVSVGYEQAWSCTITMHYITDIIEAFFI